MSIERRKKFLLHELNLLTNNYIFHYFYFRINFIIGFIQFSIVRHFMTWPLMKNTKKKFNLIVLLKSPDICGFQLRTSFKVICEYQYFVRLKWIHFSTNFCMLDKTVDQHIHIVFVVLINCFIFL